MPAEDKIAIHRRYNDEVLSQGKLELVDEIIASDYLHHTPPLPDASGREALKQFIGMARAAFPDVYFTVEDRFVQGDRLAVRWVARGTHKGDYMGIPATGKQVTLTGMAIHRFVGNQIQESWDYLDNLGVLQQLGAIPAPGQG